MRPETEQVELFGQIILANELDGNERAAYRFSDPDGVKTGKSGWSFGRCQFDTKNNPISRQCLAACGFTPAEIDGIVDQTIDIRPQHARLKANAAIIDRYDRVQLLDCIRRVKSVAVSKGIVFADDKAVLTAADYDNQFYFSAKMEPGYLCFYLANLKRPATAADIVHFKADHTTWGKKRPDDIERRAANIDRIMKGA